MLRAASCWGPHRRRVVDTLQLGAVEDRPRKHPQPWVVHLARHWRQNRNQMPHQRTLSSSFRLQLVRVRLAHIPGIVWVLGCRRRAGHSLPEGGSPLVVLPLESSRLCLVALNGWEEKRVALVTKSAGGIDVRRRVVTAPGTPQSVSRQRNRVNLVAYGVAVPLESPEVSQKAVARQKTAHQKKPRECGRGGDDGLRWPLGRGAPANQSSENM